MKKILIINANYYNDISNNLYLSAKKVLKSRKIKISVINVAGVFEIPVIIRKHIKKFDGFIALGCVIKGETSHYQYISESTFYGIMKISIEFGKPVGNGIITAQNLKQAKARSNLKNSAKPNKGSEAAKAVISVMIGKPKKK
tara:strand:- start:248 stop:673 length:426 start_codon:yes stop_codon:yes gene_type:complete